MVAAAAATLAAAVGASSSAGSGEGPSRAILAIQERSPFYDYDCMAVRKPALIDWSELHGELERSVEMARSSASALPRPPRNSGRIFFGFRARALEECPLAVLNLALLHFYTALRQAIDVPDRITVMAEAQEIADGLLRLFPVHQICASRWPVFEVLELFELRLSHEDSILQQLACDDVSGVVNWSSFRRVALTWADTRLQSWAGLDDVSGQELMQPEVDMFLQHVLDSHEQSREECPVGFAFAIGAVSLSSATRLTQHFTRMATLLDETIRESSFYALAASGWPILSSLAWLSDMNKGRRLVKLNAKYGRRFGDLDMRINELSPLVPPPAQASTDAVSAWRSRGAARAVMLARLPPERFRAVVRARLRRSTTRPILRRALAAVLDASHGWPTSAAVPAGPRRLVALTLLYGSSWSPLFVRILRHLHALGFQPPLLVVSIGKEAFRACRSATQMSAEWTSPRVACWRPDTASQVHRFTIIHILLHLGIDTFYFDMDTFFFRNPLPSVFAQVSRNSLDTLFSSHADGDCINIGVFYIRSTIRSTVWFSQFLEYYHDHQYECDQRTLNVFLGYPLRSSESKLGISFRPRNLAPIRADVLEDWNRFTIGWIGWAGAIERMLCFHWCNIPLERKWRELDAVYAAAEAVRGSMPIDAALAAVAPGWRPDFREPSDPPPLPPLALAGRDGSATVAGALGEEHIAMKDGNKWHLVRRARQIFDAYQLPAVAARGICW
eukprot:TRINITY_DN14083_c0_g1_i1.p1 TRINITY_DN14083_c0_g1~~TRINITY_DN14083_c0_g1_i1.p1  ORF type:complete len:730 (+),score=116.57 TRINITY_DN14083_c0_g1_i1:53-2242(+)